MVDVWLRTAEGRPSQGRNSWISTMDPLATPVLLHPASLTPLVADFRWVALRTAAHGVRRAAVRHLSSIFRSSAFASRVP